MIHQIIPFLITGLLLLSSLPFLPAQKRESNKFRLSDSLPIRQDVRIGKLDNGLTYYVAYNQKPEDRAELRLVVNAGSLQEEDDQLGVAHFVEHMAFNGSKHFQKNELIDYLESTGVRFGADLNAYTSFEETVYILQARSDSLALLEKGLLILEDWAYGLSLEEKEIEKERGVVISEWRTRLSADQRMQQQTFPVLYKGSRYAERLPIGKPEIIDTISPARIKQFYMDWYRPDLMAIVAIGDFEVDWMEAQIKARFNKIPIHPNPRKRETYNIPFQEGTLYSLVNDSEAAFTRTKISYKHQSKLLKNIGDYRQDLIRILYNKILNFRMQDIGFQADPPFTFAYAGYGNDIGDLAAYTISALTAEGEAIRGLEAVFREVKRVKRYGFNLSELERHKSDLMVSADRVVKESDKTTSNHLAMACVRHFVHDAPLLHPEQYQMLYRQLLPSIELNEINQIDQNWLSEENRVVTITAPDKKGALPSIAELEEMFERFEQMEVTPYVDEMGDQPLLDIEFPVSTMIEEHYFDSLNMYEWRLANGVKVVLKPTDFKNDEILMNSFSPGGHSIYEDSDFQTASLAALIMSRGGVGKFDFVQLQKKLAGKTINVGAYIDELYEGINGNCAPKDFETMLKLVYLHFTAPRKDQDALTSYINRQKNILTNMQMDPGYYYAIESAKIRYNNHPRRQAILSLEDLASLNLDRALEIYQDRFADASDFTFVFVGNFDIDSIKPLISTYLGNLPATNRKESWKDVKARLAKGVIDSTIVRGQAPKAKVNITFHGDFDYEDGDKRYVFSSMIRLLNIKLRESMREEKGGVYGVSLRGNTHGEPYERYSINLSFTCDPTEVEELLAIAMQEIDSLKQIGATPANLKKITEIQRQSAIRVLKENRFWVAQLVSRYKRGKPINKLGLSVLEERIGKLDGEAIREAARVYFDMGNVIRLVLLPEKG